MVESGLEGPLRWMAELYDYEDAVEIVCLPAHARSIPPI